ncbi:MAG: hypothetical protein JWM68_4531 [Verrucomicrobiales bacterium]|nr:hypothetical protein [Verrucomicrobiales bacterium]
MLKTLAGHAAERELILDTHFANGFTLWEPKPGQHVRYGELKGREPKAKAVWGLSQWSSKFPLDPATLTVRDGVAVCSNSAKGITLGPTKTGKADFSMAVNTGPEYGEHARKAGDPWVHLLVEQEFNPPAPLSNTASATLHIETRLLHARDLHKGDYSPEVHAAQFQLFFTVQNRNQQSSGHGDLLWFGVPIYDNRDRFTKAFKAQDFGGTKKFIFMPEGKTFTPKSAHDGKWIVIDKDLLPLMREALETAWAQGFLTQSKRIGDYYIGGMNMGWELPGTFDVEMQVRNLSLKLHPVVADH